MALISDIIRDAYRESNLIAIGTDPSGAQSDEGLVLFNRLIASVFGHEAGEGLVAADLPENGEVDSNTVIYLSLIEAKTLYLPEAPRDGARFAFVDIAGNLGTYNVTIDPNGRLINGLASEVYDVSGDRQEFLYNAETGSWQTISDLEITDIFPFPEEFEDFFVAALAIRLNPRNSAPTAPETTAIFRRLSGQFKSKYSQAKEVRSESGLVRTPGEKNRGLLDFYTGDPWL